MSITYELAKKLKDSGFPQMPYKGDVWFQNIRVPFSLVKQAYLDDGSQFAYIEYLTSIPVLSELIEAFPYFESLKKDGECWKAEGANKKVPHASEIDLGIGSTPEEAVALLWLKLNKK